MATGPVWTPIPKGTCWADEDDDFLPSEPGTEQAAASDAEFAARTAAAGVQAAAATAHAQACTAAALAAVQARDAAEAQADALDAARAAAENNAHASRLAEPPSGSASGAEGPAEFTAAASIGTKQDWQPIAGEKNTPPACSHPQVCNDALKQFASAGNRAIDCAKKRVGYKAQGAVSFKDFMDAMRDELGKIQGCRKDNRIKAESHKDRMSWCNRYSHISPHLYFRILEGIEDVESLKSPPCPFYLCNSEGCKTKKGDRPCTSLHLSTTVYLDRQRGAQFKLEGSKDLLGAFRSIESGYKKGGREFIHGLLNGNGSPEYEDCKGLIPLGIIETLNNEMEGKQWADFIATFCKGLDFIQVVSFVGQGISDARDVFQEKIKASDGKFLTATNLALSQVMAQAAESPAAESQAVYTALKNLIENARPL